MADGEEVAEAATVWEVAEEAVTVGEAAVETATHGVAAVEAAVDGEATVEKAVVGEAAVMATSEEGAISEREEVNTAAEDSSEIVDLVEEAAGQAEEAAAVAR